MKKFFGYFFNVSLTFVPIPLRQFKKLHQFFQGRCARKNVQLEETEAKEDVNAPHSLVICRGATDKNLDDLKADLRNVMEPYTGTELKDRKKNSTRDFLSISSYFHVKNIIILSSTNVGAYLKIGR